MEGGAYKTQGADTCVYIPSVACAKRGKKTLRTAPAGTQLVSRITRDSKELNIQKAVIVALNGLWLKGIGISSFFNLADSACAPEFKVSDQRSQCTVGVLQGNESGLTNLVTPKQDETLESSILNRTKPDALIKTSLRDLMFAMARLNSEYVTHSDTHFGNLGWMGNQLVIFDWGRGTRNRAEFKKWASKYVDSWNEHERAYWMGYNQHTVQFSLVEEMMDKKTIKKPGAYQALISVWDVLGLLGPARTHGIVSEPRTRAFLNTLFGQIVKDPSIDATSLVIRLIPSLFADPPAIHPATADRQMPPAEAKILSRVVPNPETATPTPVPAPSILQAIGLAPAPPPPPPPPAPDSAPPPESPAPVEDKKMTDIKNACRALLAPSGGRRTRRRKLKGGAFLTSGADTCVYSPEVACAKRPDPPIPPGDYVSRITEKKGTAKDKRNQELVKDAIQRIKEKYGMDVSASFNLAVAVCTPKFKESDLVGGPCEADEDNTTAIGKQKDKLNFITPKQDEDFRGSTDARNPIMIEKLRRLFRDVVFLNNEGIVHGDIHDENVSWMGDHLVLHDWGRTYIGVKGMKKAIKEKYFDLTALRDMFSRCTIVLERNPDDDTLRRYIMFYDIVEMTYELLKNSTPRVQHADLDTFIDYLNTVWDSKVSGDELRVKILMGVNMLFPQGQAPPPPPPPPESPAPAPAPGSAPLPGSPAPAPGSAPLPGSPAPAPGSAPLPGSPAPAPAPVEDKKMTDIKNACRALLGSAGGTRRRRHRRTRKRIGRKMKGGVFLGAGGSAMVFGLKSTENFLPPPVGSTPSLPPGLGPGDIVAHVTKTEDDVVGKNALVQGVGAADPYVKMITNPSIVAYDVNTDAFLGSFVRAQENLISGSSAKKLYKEWSAGVQPPLTCSLMLRHNTFRKGDVLSLVDIMIGLVHINGRFAHCDLNDSNMGIMADGCPVITDYDRVQTDGARLSMYIERYMFGNTGAYPWFADIEEIYGNMGATTEEEVLQFMGQLMKIVDLLTVAWFVGETHPELSAITRTFRDGIKASWKTIPQKELHKRVSNLGQLIVKATTGREWRPMTMEDELRMAAEYNARPQPARNSPGLWDATRNHYRFGAS